MGGGRRRVVHAAVTPGGMGTNVWGVRQGGRRGGIGWGVFQYMGCCEAAAAGNAAASLNTHSLSNYKQGTV